MAFRKPVWVSMKFHAENKFLTFSMESTFLLKARPTILVFLNFEREMKFHHFYNWLENTYDYFGVFELCEKQNFIIFIMGWNVRPIILVFSDCFGMTNFEAETVRARTSEFYEQTNDHSTFIIFASLQNKASHRRQVCVIIQS